MKHLFSIISLFAFIALASQAAPATFTPETKGDRIVLLGGSLIHGMEDHGYFEAAVTARWPRHDLSFRNVGWPVRLTAGFWS
tara:strand:+ start:1039 stop:1284 length:246 start_codon:yes stop_codon:yes gene_type:complete